MHYCVWVQLMSVYGSVSLTSSFTCHFQLLLCALTSLMLLQSPEMLFDRCMRDWTHVWFRLPLPLPLACYSSCCCSSSKSRCVYLLCCPSSLLPVPLSLQYGSSVWEAAIPLFSHPLHLSVLLGVLAPLCPLHPVEGSGSKSLWYLALWCPEQVKPLVFCLFSHWPAFTTFSAADRRHLVTASAASLPASAALKPNRLTQPLLFASISLLPLLICSMPVLPLQSFIITHRTQANRHAWNF